MPEVLPLTAHDEQNHNDEDAGRNENGVGELSEEADGESNAVEKGIFEGVVSSLWLLQEVY